MTDIAAHAARLAAARFHARCDAHDPCVGIDGMERQHRLGDPPPPGLAFHTEDHRTPAEKKAAALDALAAGWEYVRAHRWTMNQLPGGWQRDTPETVIELTFDMLQREGATDA